MILKASEPEAAGRPVIQAPGRPRFFEPESIEAPDAEPGPAAVPGGAEPPPEAGAEPRDAADAADAARESLSRRLYFTLLALLLGLLAAVAGIQLITRAVEARSQR